MKQLTIGILLIASAMLFVPQTGLCNADHESMLVCTVVDGGDNSNLEAFDFHFDHYFMLPDEILIYTPDMVHASVLYQLVKSAKQATEPSIRGPTYRRGITST